MRVYENVHIPEETPAAAPVAPPAGACERRRLAAEGGMKVSGMSGSRRRGAFNSAALRAAQGLAAEGMTIERAEIGDLPLYNEDVKAAGFPPPAERLRSQL